MSATPIASCPKNFAAPTSASGADAPSKKLKAQTVKSSEYCMPQSLKRKRKNRFFEKKQQKNFYEFGRCW
jgi:hypothetical protein